MLQLVKQQRVLARPTPWREFFGAWAQMCGQGQGYTLQEDGNVYPLSFWGVMRFMGQSFQHGFIYRFWRWQWSLQNKTK